MCSSDLFLTGLVLLVATDYPPARRTVRQVCVDFIDNWDAVKNQDGEIVQSALLDVMAKSDIDVVRSAGKAMQRRLDRDLSATMSTISRSLEFWMDPEIADSLNGSDIDFAKLRDESQTVYVTIPLQYVTTYHPFYRLVLGSAIIALSQFDDENPTSRPLFLIDEFLQLGRMDIVVNTLPITTGSGMRYWIVSQNLARLKDLYGDNWETIFSETQAKTLFGAEDNMTLEYISRYAGEQTIRKVEFGAPSDGMERRPAYEKVLLLPPSTLKSLTAARYQGDRWLGSTAVLFTRGLNAKLALRGWYEDTKMSKLQNATDERTQ